jgi:hypothetical protein
MLLDHHTKELRESGLNDATLAMAGIRSETDPAALAKLLNWDRPATSNAPGLVFPFIDPASGSFNCFARVKFDNPRINSETGKANKYEQPRDISPRPYITASVIPGLQDPRIDLLVGEGEKKILASIQAGVLAIGLCGIWTWQKPKSEPRELVDDLANIDLAGRNVPILFDLDRRHNPDAAHSAAELARVLEDDHGAIVTIINFPLRFTTRDESGIHRKLGIDDFIVKHGEEAYRNFIAAALTPPTPPQPITSFQDQITAARLESIGIKGVVYLDRSQTGAGKSHADRAAMTKVGSSLTILSTHRNCAEVEKELLDLQFDAARFPPLNRKTCQRYDEVEKAIAVGLSVSGAFCPTCIHKDHCEYQQGMHSAELAAHKLATHHRASVSLDEISKRVEFMSVHEDPTSLLRPTVEVSTPLAKVAAVARYSWQNLVSPTEAPFFRRMEQIAERLDEILFNAEQTQQIDLPISHSSPPATIDSTLWKAIQSTNIYPDANSMKCIKAITDGKLLSLTVRVDQILKPGRETETARSLVAIWQTQLPAHCPVWLNDATADLEEIQAICGLHVVDCTPAARAEQLKPILQIPVDVTKSTTPKVFVRTLRAVMDHEQFADAQKIGIICDRKFITAITGTAKNGAVLPEAYRNRIAKVEHFRGGEGRGSNAWTTDCDLLLIIGTPRVPPPVVRTRLIRMGLTQAAARPESWTAWGRDYWSGRNTDGKRVTVTTRNYRDHDWRHAHALIVAAELKQCFGRARSIRQHGIPAVILTTENLGLPLASFELKAVSEADEKVLRAVGELVRLSDTFPKGVDNDTYRTLLLNKILLARVSVSSSEVAKRIDRNEKSVRRSLIRLEQAGFVKRVGERGGWVPSSPGNSSPASAEPEAPAAAPITTA